MNKVMIEFFSGSKVMSETFKKAGYDVFTIDNNPDLKPDLCINILDLEIKDIPEKYRKPDVIWASPPCTTFSVASLGHYWIDRKPRRWKTYIGLAIAKKTTEIIQELNPDFYFIENPVGMLRKQHFMERFVRKTVNYCQYGEKYMKPTDIFTNAYSWIPRQRCRPGDTCHELSPRKEKKKGLQSLDGNYQRSKIPQQLCNEIVDVCEGNLKTVQKTLKVP
jgi:site-specific DNA-cytosine methylase